MTSPTIVPALSRRHLLTLGLGVALPGAGRSQPAFPSRTLSMVVPYTAGGASDIGARMLNTEVGRLLGQSVIIDNVGGAAGALGVQKVVRAPADGHTLLYGSLSEALLVPMINRAAGYRIEDLQPVAFVGGTPAVLVTRPDFPATDIDQFITLARRSLAGSATARRASAASST
jgi:tripartite-type tricarboxylate transporter receptor subunit TctC